MSTAAETTEPLPRRRLAVYPDPVLRRRAEPVASFDDALRDLVADLRILMKNHRGVGIAAPQAGESKRVFLACGEDLEGEPFVFVNPRLHDFGGEGVVAEEGCLSLPEILGHVARPQAVSITAFDLDGREFTLRSEGFPARVWQHEMDHLDGVLILDRMRAIDRLSNRRAIKELEAASSGA
ncbi:MAG: peptide deformylase [Phycisphaerales bacterium]|jgi:peptide deformylase